MKRTVARVAAAAIAGCCASVTALAANPLGFYVGGGVGQADVRLDRTQQDLGLEFDEQHFGWKALVGLRPIPFLGAEAEYVDFGHPSFQSAGGFSAASGDARARSAALYGLGYLPIGGPFLDIYAKAGLARLQLTANGTVTPCPLCPTGLFRLDRTDTRFAYGAGVQVKLAGLGVRGEYQRISSSFGDPSFLSLALTWTF